MTGEAYFLITMMVVLTGVVLWGLWQHTKITEDEIKALNELYKD